MEEYKIVEHSDWHPENKIRLKSGMTIEQLFHNLVTDFAPGPRPDSVVKGTLNFIRNARKYAWRVVTSSENARKLTPAKHDKYINEETSELSVDEKKEVVKMLCELEKERVITVLKKTFSLLIEGGVIDKDLIKGVYLMGSLINGYAFPQDIDSCMLVEREIDANTYLIIRDTVESELQKEVGLVPITEPLDLEKDPKLFFIRI